MCSNEKYDMEYWHYCKEAVKIDDSDCTADFHRLKYSEKL